MGHIRRLSRKKPYPSNRELKPFYIHMVCLLVIHHSVLRIRLPSQALPCIVGATLLLSTCLSALALDATASLARRVGASGRPGEVGWGIFAILQYFCHSQAESFMDAVWGTVWTAMPLRWPSHK